jgi:hypothetical protein
MATTFLADEFLLLEIEDELAQSDPYLDTDSLSLLDIDDADARALDHARWAYQVPCPGTRYYFWE